MSLVFFWFCLLSYLPLYFSLIISLFFWTFLFDFFALVFGVHLSSHSLSPAMNEDHECHDRVRPNCFYCFVFIFVAPGTRHWTGQQFKLKQGPEQGVQAVLSPNYHILCGGWRISSCRGKGRRKDICGSVLFIHCRLYALYLDSLLTWILIFFQILVDRTIKRRTRRWTRIRLWY